MENSFGIIGGADGPTAIFVAERLEKALTIFAGGLAVGIGIGLIIAALVGIIVYILTKNKYKKQ